jgi:hypothetical protein
MLQLLWSKDLEWWVILQLLWSKDLEWWVILQLRRSE